MAEFNSGAERFAEHATKLPQFRTVNLRGVKDTVAQVLEMIGKVEGIFSTYTKHDISHIDSMLQMLDWLVPPEARRVMTSVDWLMIVLSIYLHDLGMVVTSAEFDGRMENEEFLGFLDRLKKDPEAKDYLARADTMTEAEKERFFYQEYVRDKHAVRIREWITGQHSRFWLKDFQVISNEIGSLMANLPTRFRENLAVVCQSHHENNLDRTDIYPLAQKYGNDASEIANVQYAALILRTVDLIHVTKDRTPSVMYKSIKFTDLKSVDEWDKQRGVWSVSMKGREFNPEDEESHVIEVTADFTEERPFFALTEYIAWANQEIRQTKRWGDASQQTADAKGFIFPWREIKGDIRVAGNLPRPMRFELDRGRLLDLLVGHTIYNEPTVAVRELLQNAIDAVRFQQHLDEKNPARSTPDKPKMGRVLVDWNPETRLLTVEDNGTGMDLATIENHLLRVGSSFYDTPQFQSENAGFTPISRFGIGILTCFMISDNIEIITCRSGVGRRIRMSSVHADYLLKDLPPGDAQLDGLEPHGTKIRLVLRPSVKLKDRGMLDIVRQWIIVPACEVIYSQLGEKPQRVGFEDAVEALRDMISDKQSQGADSSLAVMNVTFKEADGASYDLAFAVQTGFFPERAFVVNERMPISAVCIEGIRADWHLPGFKSGLWAMLSVRGNRRFRTTVSRQSLEADEEYQGVAKMCATWLFKHVKDEVERISALSGSPLSQASTAGRWVYKSLTSAADTPALLETLSTLYAEHPSVVLEYSRSHNESIGIRKLQSINDVAVLAEFWTIESRTVDYLGVISRDLGKELNISSFLGSLAPEQYNAKVNPIVMDPEAFLPHLIKSHRVVEVDFSRKHQRTLLRWERFSETERELEVIFGRTTRLQLLNFVVQKGISVVLRGLRQEEIPEVLHTILRVVVVPAVNGDVSDIVLVRTRLVTVLTEGSTIADTWTLIDNTLRTFHAELSLDERLVLLSSLLTIATPLMRRDVYNRMIDPDDIAAPWRALVNDINKILAKFEIDKTLPSEFRQVLGSESQWFDASYFWRNWNQQI
jgi:molecular chaperone HtpG